MVSLSHTFGVKCRLAPVPRLIDDNGLPPVDAQFFYSSQTPIDDPLSTSISQFYSEAKPTKGNMRPFSRGDNNALEKAWLGLSSPTERKEHTYIQRARAQTESAARITDERSRVVIRKIAEQHSDKHGSNPQLQDAELLPETPAPTATSQTCCSDLLSDLSEELQYNFCSLERRVNLSLSLDHLVSAVMGVLHQAKQSAAGVLDAGIVSVDPSLNARHRADMSVHEEVRAKLTERGTNRHRSNSQATDTSIITQTSTDTPGLKSKVNSSHGITGKPFIRVGSEDSNSNSEECHPSNSDFKLSDPGDNTHHRKSRRHGSDSPLLAERSRAKGTAEVAVGVSRLHVVSLPALQMKPIYWSPVNDVAFVTRATWFYRNTMLPILPIVANQLEAGYRELRPWSDIWRDEIRCAIEVGPAGEEKVSHRLWPEDEHSDGRHRYPLEPKVSGDPYCAARCSQGEASAEGSFNTRLNAEPEKLNRPFQNYHVVYKNEKEAFLLKPTLKPSAYYGRRPIQKIARGLTIGIPVVRGFDVGRWEQLHQKSRPSQKLPVSAANESHGNSGVDVCQACKAEKESGEASDLILVAHGIGQKFAERVESFHFTHAINNFRRAVNVELTNPLVQGLLRPEHNGLMILPLNWRAGLSFEDGGPARDGDRIDYAPEGFGLKDIEPDTIPAIRSMISDVMFDIPFYMSHHKGKMIKALVSEANRVYRLWCLNNPGFLENGRVHLIGHSLGSAMALEILSRQPASVPPLDLSQPQPETRFFEFDTHNLFLVGSPAGFFLLLERGILMPRRGRLKPGVDLDDTNVRGIVGEADTFGCLAVDNIYNVLAKEDPIAYLLNGAVDPGYAASLQKAFVPSTSTSMLRSVGDVFRSVIPGMPTPADPFAPQTSRPTNMRLPSQLELEVHDFSREELTEKKAYLLNDNGQIDWFLRSSGGPLELQYLNMLSAHTSYWTNQDFVRMLCIETGRKPGRGNTLPAFRAVKNVKISKGTE